MWSKTALGGLVLWSERSVSHPMTSGGISGSMKAIQGKTHHERVGMIDIHTCDGVK
jgi:hypothetical protein